MSPHFRRHYELMSFILNIAVPISLVVVIAAQHFQLASLSQEIETLRADIATIRLNSLPTSNVSPNTSSSNTATTSK